MMKQNVKNVILAVVIVLIFVLLVWNIVVLNKLSEEIYYLKLDIRGTESPWAYMSTGGLEEKIMDIQLDIWEIQDQMGIESPWRFFKGD